MDTDLNAQHITHVADLLWAWAALFLPRVAASIAILVFGIIIVGWIDRAVGGGLSRVRTMDSTLRPILASLVRYTLIILVVIGALSQLGVQTTSLLAVLGAAGLAIGLALQGTLSNIAAGIMLLWLRPFQVGDFIEVGALSGAVQEMGLFVCQLRTYDGLFLFMPNSSIWNQPLKNYTRNAGRLISINVAIPVAAELDRARQALLTVAGETENVMQHPEPAVFLDNVGGGMIVFSLLIWTTPQGAGLVERVIIEAIKQSLQALGEAYTPTQIVRATPPDTDPSRFLEGRQPAR